MADLAPSEGDAPPTAQGVGAQGGESDAAASSASHGHEAYHSLVSVPHAGLSTSASMYDDFFDEGAADDDARVPHAIQQARVHPAAPGTTAGAGTGAGAGAGTGAGAGAAVGSADPAAAGATKASAGHAATRAGNRAGRDVDWGSRVAEVEDMPTSTYTQRRVRLSRLRSLHRDFHQFTELYARVIISELGLPPRRRTINPVALGGVAGGQKFMVR